MYGHVCIRVVVRFTGHRPKVPRCAQIPKENYGHHVLGPTLDKATTVIDELKNKQLSS